MAASAPRRQKKILPPHRPAGLSSPQAITWTAIWRRWLHDEGRLVKWRRHLRQEGFRSWSAWRKAVVVAPFGLSRRRWTLYRVTDPRVIPTWSGGPFPRWVTGPYRGAQTRTFAWLVATGRTSEERKKTGPKKLPPTMFMFGLLYRGRVIVLDGMHRSAAVAERLKAGQPVKSKIIIALADTKKLPRLGGSLK